VKVLFVSHNFPPEVNALARRVYDHGVEWVRQGWNVEVLTGVPHFPEGVVYAGYRNRLRRENVDGIDVLRVPLLPFENRGVVRRSLNYLSFMASAVWNARHVGRQPDLLVASSPHLLTGIAGWDISRRMRVPFVLEIRDLWPESIVATGVVSRNALIRLFESVARFLYERAAHIVVVTESFREYISGLGIPLSKISVIKNGVFPEYFTIAEDNGRLSELRRQYRLTGKFVVSYIGTVGVAHGIDVLLGAAERCSDPRIVFMVVGTGAARLDLEVKLKKLGLSNVRLIEKQAHDRIPNFYGLSHVSVVHLRDLPIFRTVVPSKMFEAMAAGRPVILGVEGESRRILEEAEAGVAVRPEDPDALLEALVRFADSDELRRTLGQNGRRYVLQHHDRRMLAQRYQRVLEEVVHST
jgi:colanic acid biosynthesis glycosyl transferase WcaI